MVVWHGQPAEHLESFHRVGCRRRELQLQPRLQPGITYQPALESINFNSEAWFSKICQLEDGIFQATYIFFPGTLHLRRLHLVLHWHRSNCRQSKFSQISLRMTMTMTTVLMTLIAMTTVLMTAMTMTKTMPMTITMQLQVPLFYSSWQTFALAASTSESKI